MMTSFRIRSTLILRSLKQNSKSQYGNIRLQKKRPEVLFLTQIAIFLESILILISFLILRNRRKIGLAGAGIYRSESILITECSAKAISDAQTFLKPSTTVDSLLYMAIFFLSIIP